jgi:nitrate reductase cytochrome c-type subunit
MKKLMLLVAMLAMVVTMAAVAAPVMGQEMKMEEKKGKDKEKKDKMKEMPKTGGIPVDASLLGLGAGVLLIGGGLLVRKVTR